MPKILDSLRHLMRAPHGYVADGRTLGLGLATALAKQRDAAQVLVNTDEADTHLRRWAADQQLKAGR